MDEPPDGSFTPRTTQLVACLLSVSLFLNAWPSWAQTIRFAGDAVPTEAVSAAQLSSLDSPFTGPTGLALALPGSIAIQPLNVNTALSPSGLTSASALTSAHPLSLAAPASSLASVSAARAIPAGNALHAQSSVRDESAGTRALAIDGRVGSPALPGAPSQTLEERVWKHAEARGFEMPGRAAPQEALAGAAAPERSSTRSEPLQDAALSRGTIITMSDLLMTKPISEIRQEIFDISLNVGWSSWLYDISGYLETEDKNNILLVVENNRILGYLLLGHAYQSTIKRMTVYEGNIYVAYVAVRQEPGLKGVGQKLFLEAAARAKRDGESELVLHVKKGDKAYGFYQRMSRYVPIQSEEEDTTHVAGEIWIKMTFDLKDARLDGLDQVAPRDDSSADVSNPVEPGTTAASVKDEPRRSIFSLSTVGFLASQFASELWIEATAFAFPLLSAAVSHGFAGIAGVASFATFALTGGSMLGGPAVSRFGAGTVYRVTLGMRAALAGALFVAYGSSFWSLGLLAALISVDYFVIGINRVAGVVYPQAKFGSLLSLQNRFGTVQQRVVSAVALVGGPSVAVMIAWLGFGPMLGLLASVMAVGALVASLVNTSESVDASTPGAFSRSLHVLRADPELRRAAWGYGVPAAMVFFLYFVVFPGFGMYVAHTESSTALVMGALAGIFGASLYLGAWVSGWLTERAERGLAALTEVPETQRAAAFRRVFLDSTRKWLAAAGISLASLWAFAVAAPVFGMYLAYPAVALIGFATSGAMVQSESLLRSGAPKELAPSFLGSVRTLVMAATAAGFLPLGLMFAPFTWVVAGALVPQAWAFVALGVAASVGAAAFVFMAKGLAPVSHPASAQAAALPPIVPRNGDTDQVMMMSDLAEVRPREDIKNEIRGLSAASGFGEWQDVVDSYLAPESQKPVILVADADNRILGFLILEDRITTDFGRRTVLPQPSYVAYVAARPDTKGRRVGKKLMMRAARMVNWAGGKELSLHVEADSDSIGFYRAMGKYLPIKSETRDNRYVAGTRWIKFVYDVSKVD